MALFTRIYAVSARGISSCRILSSPSLVVVPIPVSNGFLQQVRNTPWRRCLSTSAGSHQSPKGQEDAHGSSSFTDFDTDPNPNPDNSVRDQEAEEEFQIKLKILGAALNHVNEKGWSSDALRAAAADLNLSDSIASLCTPYDIVEYFQRSANRQLEGYLLGLEKKDKSLYSSVEYRLKLVIPHIDKYHQAMGLSLEPQNVPRSLRVLRELSDSICINGLGDSSTDLRWYTKRTGIISLYVTTECCMVQDKSEGFKETWDFLQRRVKDFEFLENAGSTAIPILESGFTTILNILGMNRRR